MSDESVTSSKEESYSDSIVSILSNLEALENVYFIITTRDYENIIFKFRKNSLILYISSKKFFDNIKGNFLYIKFVMDASIIRNVIQ